MIKTLFSFFILNQMKNRRLLVLILFGIVPIVLIFCTILIKPLLDEHHETLPSFFSNFSFLVYLHFLVPIFSILIGIGIIADEVENSTLPYLLVRPVPRHVIILTKFLAHFFIGSIIIILSQLISYILAVLIFKVHITAVDISFLLHSSSVHLLGFAVYGMLFALLGGWLHHSMIVAILFVFGWEKTITYVPGHASYLAIMNYLQALYPSIASSQIIRNYALVDQFSIVTALAILFALLSLFGILTAMLPSIKEYHN